MIGALSVSAGERVQLLFEVDGRPLDLAAEVVRAEPLDMVSSRVAVRFVELTDEVLVLIRRLIAGMLRLEVERLATTEDG